MINYGFTKELKIGFETAVNQVTEKLEKEGLNFKGYKGMMQEMEDNTFVIDDISQVGGLAVFQQVDHLDRGRGGLPALVAGLGAGPLDGLFDGVRRDDAEDHGNLGFHGNLGDALGRFGADVVEMGRRTANHRAEADDGVVATGGGHFLGQHGLIAKCLHHYEDLLRIPFLVRWPGVVQPASVTEIAEIMALANHLVLSHPPNASNPSRSFQQVPCRIYFIH